jgi:hypothetical protein
MTLLTICQSVARTSKVAIPSTIIGNSALEAVRLLEAARETVKDLLKRIDFVELQGEATITTVASTEGYSLPSDFERIIDGTAWNVSRRREMFGVVTPREWQDLKNRTASNSSYTDRYRIRGGEVLIYPTPSSVESLVYEYIQNTPIESSGGTAQTDWLADTDLPRIDAFLVELGMKWRFRKMNGMPYEEDLRQYNEIGATVKAQDGGRRKICSSSRYPRGVKVAYPESVVAPS